MIEEEHENKTIFKKYLVFRILLGNILKETSSFITLIPKILLTSDNVPVWEIFLSVSAGVCF